MGFEMKKILMVSAITFSLLWITACSSELSDNDAVRLATDKYFEKELKELRLYEPQATRRTLALKVEGSEVLSNDGVNATVGLTLKGIDEPRRGYFPKPYTVEIDVIKPE
jgi:hypothetical protein